MRRWTPHTIRHLRSGGNRLHVQKLIILLLALQSAGPVSSINIGVHLEEIFMKSSVRIDREKSDGPTGSMWKFPQFFHCGMTFEGISGANSTRMSGLSGWTRGEVITLESLQRSFTSSSAWSPRRYWLLELFIDGGSQLGSPSYLVPSQMRIPL